MLLTLNESTLKSHTEHTVKMKEKAKKGKPAEESHRHWHESSSSQNNNYKKYVMQVLTKKLQWRFGREYKQKYLNWVFL